MRLWFNSCSFVFCQGHSSHETVYNFVDHSAIHREQARRAEEERLRIEREQREKEEKEKIEREAREAAERERERLQEELRKKRAEEEAREKERQRRENERIEEERQQKLKKQQELDQKSSKLRTSLREYKFGDKLGRSTFDALSVSGMTQLRIGMFGPTGSGKSCFINTCEQSVRQTDKGSVPESSAGEEGTIILEDYLPEMFFKLVDTRGFFNYDADESVEFRDILAGKIRSGDVIRRGEPRDVGEDVPFVDALHGVIFVLKANDIRLKNERLQEYLKPMRDVIADSGLPQSISAFSLIVGNCAM